MNEIDANDAIRYENLCALIKKLYRGRSCVHSRLFRLAVVSAGCCVGYYVVVYCTSLHSEKATLRLP
jgi:hypothetical protein